MFAKDFVGDLWEKLHTEITGSIQGGVAMDSEVQLGTDAHDINPNSISGTPELIQQHRKGNIETDAVNQFNEELRVAKDVEEYALVLKQKLEQAQKENREMQFAIGISQEKLKKYGR